MRWHGFGRFRGAHDAVHHVQHQQRVSTSGGLGRQHDRVAAVPDCIGHVARLGPRGRLLGDHRFEHLRGGNHRYAAVIGVLNDAFLEHRHLLGRQLDAQVAAGNHYRVGHVQDLVEIVDRLALFELDHQWRGAPDVAHQLVGCPHLRRGAHEGQRDIVDAQLLESERHVRAVLFGDRRRGHRHAWQVDALVLAQRATLFDARPDLAVFGPLHGEADAPVGQAVGRDDLVERITEVGRRRRNEAEPGRRAGQALEVTAHREGAARGYVQPSRAAVPTTSWVEITTSCPALSSTGPPPSSAPTRILGPCRSCITATERPVARAASRIAAQRRACSAGVPWEKFSRATSSPAPTSSCSSPSVAGPSVATILARLTRSTSGAPRRSVLSHAAEELLGQLVERQLGGLAHLLCEVARRLPI